MLYATPPELFLCNNTIAIDMSLLRSFSIMGSKKPL